MKHEGHSPCMVALRSQLAEASLARRKLDKRIMLVKADSGCPCLCVHNALIPDPQSGGIALSEPTRQGSHVKNMA